MPMVPGSIPVGADICLKKDICTWFLVRSPDHGSVGADICLKRDICARGRSCCSWVLIGMFLSMYVSEKIYQLSDTEALPSLRFDDRVLDFPSMFIITVLDPHHVSPVLAATDSGGGVSEEAAVPVQHEAQARPHGPLPPREEVRRSRLQVPTK